ncbi:MAG: SUF system Fe-S cluster assembly regulator [Rhodospirillales bacterium]|nr:SUF system Fe-S cluster assembly regulator [Alphaproteobacteria bacterium]MCB9976803.1 SUF system Fe-S cluster assembly regulator [Rhodospirillales bacterium]
MIRISKLADYAVVMLTSMAQERGVVLSAAALSERTRISEPTVAKILKILGQDGLVASQRGAHGGYKLARAPERIPISAVIEALDGPIALTTCVDGALLDCSLAQTCGVRGRWDEVNITIRNALEEITLADMMRGKTCCGPLQSNHQVQEETEDHYGRH